MQSEHNRRTRSMAAVLILASAGLGAAVVTHVGAQQPAEKTIPDKVKLFIPYKEYSTADNQRILEMYKYLRVADVSDGMDVVGLQDCRPGRSGNPRALEGHGHLLAPRRRHCRDRALRSHQQARAKDGR